MRILYATDGSDGALQGALSLAHLPLGEDSQVMILTVLPERGHDEAAGWAPREVARQVLADSHARLTTHIRHGDPAEVILTALEKCPVDLVVVGSRGRSAFERFFLGSVAERVVRHVACPVLVVRRQHTHFHHVLVGVDGSASSLYAVDWLRRLPLPSGTREAGGSEIRLTTVLPLNDSLAHTKMVPLPSDLGGASQETMKAAIHRQRDALSDLQALAVSFEMKGLRTVTGIRYGDPAPALLELAEESHTDLVVLGSQGHGAIERFLLGSVSEKVMRHAHCSVLIVKQPVEREYATTAAAGLPEMQGAIA